MESIGVDPRGIEIMAGKFQHFTVRLFGLSYRQALIIKQEMLARGAEAAISQETFKGRPEIGDPAGEGLECDALLTGTWRQFQQFTGKLKMQPFGLSELAGRLEMALLNFLSPKLPPVTIQGKAYDLSSRTYIMGIINLTPDSFSGDGLLTQNNYIDRALQQAERMVSEGADFLDIGAESTRPGAVMVDAAEEERRLIPVLKELVKTAKVPVSVDTSKPEVAAKALEAGAALINDVWGLQAPHDPEGRMAKIVAAAGIPVIVMHNKIEKNYRHLLNEVNEFLGRSVKLAEAAGVKTEQIIIDPGIGFGKTYEHNLQLLQNLSQLKILGRPILLGASRKSVVGLTLNLPVDERLEGSIATALWGVMKGANILRVHDVQATWRAVKMCDAIRFANGGAAGGQRGSVNTHA
ncbi:MAG: dihydropteroate synthase [Firmicutes bacterium]|nr:dihydropteroate synthase [Bacillota bacterium]